MNTVIYYTVTAAFVLHFILAWIHSWRMWGKPWDARYNDPARHAFEIRTNIEYAIYQALLAVIAWLGSRGLGTLTAHAFLALAFLAIGLMRLKLRRLIEETDVIMWDSELD